MEVFTQSLLDQALALGKLFTKDGKVADYIPELSMQNPHLLGLASYQDGRLLTAGHADIPFTIQSIIKVALYSIVLEHYSMDELRHYVGVQPSAKPFNSVIELELSNKNVPVNPFINAGAIVTVALIHRVYGDRSRQVIADRLANLIGREADYSEKVKASESATAYGNRTLIYLMLSCKILPADLPVEEILDIYFTSCSFLVTCRDLAHFSFVLSNEGRDKDGRPILSRVNAQILRSLMASCGTYDYSGEFALRVGLPAKSGVGGGILTASPDPFGLAVFGPALDKHGNSYAGVRMLEFLSQALNLSIY